MKLIFIHGSGGCKESWQFQTEYFIDSEAINLPGHPDGELCSSIAEYAAWVHDYIQSNGYQDVVLIGHSLGGGIVLQYALDYPANLAGIITIGSGARLRVHPDALNVVERAIEEPALMEAITGIAYDQVDSSLAELIRQRDVENSPKSFLNDLKACDNFDVMDRLGEISIPLLAIAGDQDVMTPPKYSTFLADNVAGATSVVISGGTHFVYTEKPVEVNPAIDTFINSL
ncbi:MAG: alpha/beta hydrolase [Gammaproteobacteria bacterium]|nr:alpha/beta hydrolase [Gammaproteobacteria bacterium]